MMMRCICIFLCKPNPKGNNLCHKCFKSNYTWTPKNGFAITVVKPIPSFVEAFVAPRSPSPPCIFVHLPPIQECMVCSDSRWRRARLCPWKDGNTKDIVIWVVQNMVSKQFLIQTVFDTRTSSTTNKPVQHRYSKRFSCEYIFLRGFRQQMVTKTETTVQEYIGFVCQNQISCLSPYNKSLLSFLLPNTPN